MISTGIEFSRTTGLRLGWAKVLGQDPAESRGFLRLCASARGKSLQRQTGWRSGQSGANPSLRPNSLYFPVDQGIRADSGSPGLAIGPDSPACTRTCAPRSLEPGTGNFVPRSRDSRRPTGWPRSCDRIAVPTLIVWGAEDRRIALSLGRAVANRIPNSKPEIVEGCGHKPHEERPE